MVEFTLLVKISCSSSKSYKVQITHQKVRLPAEYVVHQTTALIMHKDTLLIVRGSWSVK